MESKGSGFSTVVLCGPPPSFVIAVFVRLMAASGGKGMEAVIRN
jgi:hypothetical protein